MNSINSEIFNMPEEPNALAELLLRFLQNKADCGTNREGLKISFLFILLSKVKNAVLKQFI